VTQLRQDILNLEAKKQARRQEDEHRVKGDAALLSEKQAQENELRNAIASTQRQITEKTMALYNF